VCFNVTSKEELISIHLQEGGFKSYNISGSLFSVDWLMEAQGFGSPFGRPDGMKRKRKDSEMGLLRKRQRMS
jgi:hypothetical protein